MQIALAKRGQLTKSTAHRSCGHEVEGNDIDILVWQRICVLSCNNRDLLAKFRFSYRENTVWGRTGRAGLINPSFDPTARIRIRIFLRGRTRDDGDKASQYVRLVNQHWQKLDHSVKRARSVKFNALLRREVLTSMCSSLWQCSSPCICNSRRLDRATKADCIWGSTTRQMFRSCGQNGGNN